MKAEWSTSDPGEDDPGLYGRRVAQWYDQWYRDRQRDEAIAEFLCARAGDGPALEIGVGSGRVASPLRHHGVNVVGIDASPEMLQRCRSRDPDLPVIAMSAVDIDSLARLRPSLIYCTMATFFQIGGRAVQVRTLSAAASCAAPGAVLVLDAWQPPKVLSEIPPITVSHLVANDQVLVTVTTHDETGRSLHYRQVLIDGDDALVVPRTDHYLYPEELEAIAVAAGWRLAERWCDFGLSVLLASSPWFVQVFRLT